MLFTPGAVLLLNPEAALLLNPEAALVLKPRKPHCWTYFFGDVLAVF
jgi:hypothetical protein